VRTIHPLWFLVLGALLLGAVVGVWMAL
jgi:hypothetical protein